MTQTALRRFPDRFLWGAGTSGLQHEGSPLADGAGESAMRCWSQEALPADQTFEVTADGYRRLSDDVRLMRELGLNAQIFFPAWSRILPDGTGRVNTAGLDFYDRLVDELLAAGIAPMCSLHVFDHPIALQKRGGWPDRDSAEWFAEFAAVVFERLGDRVPYWMTMCEPSLYCMWGQWLRPALPTDLATVLRAMHHLNVGHGRAVQAFRASGASGAIGNQHLWIPVLPASSHEADVAAAARVDGFFNRFNVDAFMLGRYPEDLAEWLDERWPAVRDGDLETISTPLDFLGIDYYFPWTIAHDPTGEVMGVPLGAREIATPAPSVGESVPDGQTEGLRRCLLDLRDRYDDPTIYVVELGYSRDDVVEDGEVADNERIAYLRDHVAAVHAAIRDGVDVRGIFVWSLLDGWEFIDGLRSRYGLVHVDWETQRRVIKASGRWYGQVVARNGL